MACVYRSRLKTCVAGSEDPTTRYAQQVTSGQQVCASSYCHISLKHVRLSSVQCAGGMASNIEKGARVQCQKSVADTCHLHVKTLLPLHARRQFFCKMLCCYGLQGTMRTTHYSQGRLIYYVCGQAEPLIGMQQALSTYTLPAFASLHCVSQCICMVLHSHVMLLSKAAVLYKALLLMLAGHGVEDASQPVTADLLCVQILDWGVGQTHRHKLHIGVMTRL